MQREPEKETSGIKNTASSRPVTSTLQHVHRPLSPAFHTVWVAESTALLPGCHGVWLLSIMSRAPSQPGVPPSLQPIPWSRDVYLGNHERLAETGEPEGSWWCCVTPCQGHRKWGLGIFIFFHWGWSIFWCSYKCGDTSAVVFYHQTYLYSFTPRTQTKLKTISAVVCFTACFESVEQPEKWSSNSKVKA